MKENYDFVVVGSGGGGGTIAWQLAKAGYTVALLEQGRDLAEMLNSDKKKYPDFDPAVHDEFYFRWRKPDEKRRPRGDYNTFRRNEESDARPFKNGWTGSTFGGGSVLWGTWSFRALPVDFRLQSHYRATKQLKDLKDAGYTVADWPISYDEMKPFYDVAEALLAVSGDRTQLVNSIKQSPWFKRFQDSDYFQKDSLLETKPGFPCGAYPRTPVGEFVWHAMEKARMSPAALPSAIVQPGSDTYRTREAIARSLAGWEEPGPFWSQKAEQLWSDRVRDACNMCGYCGEFICWGRQPPKSGARASTLEELKDLDGRNADIVLGAKAVEVMFNPRTRRATGVRYLDTSGRNANSPKVRTVAARHVIVSCGAVQSARLLFMSGPPGGLGNSSDQLGRHATFHLFGLGLSATFKQDKDKGIRFQGLLHGEYGHTGNVTTMWPYFVQHPETNLWHKAGTMTSTARKNPLENALEQVERDGLIGRDLIRKMEAYARTLQVRLTGDDLPMAGNRVDLDPNYVDEYGVPVARVTRDLGPAEWQMYNLVKPILEGLVKPYQHKLESSRVSPAVVDLIGDHQMGTCRMGSSAKDSVIDRNCRLWDAPNVFVVDSSFMPTGLGLNPMVTVVANALRVGTWIVNESSKGRPIDVIRS